MASWQRWKLQPLATASALWKLAASKEALAGASIGPLHERTSTTLAGLALRGGVGWRLRPCRFATLIWLTPWCIRLLRGLDHLQQLLSTDQFNGLSSGECFRVRGIAADADDLHCLRLVVGEEPGHLPHHADAHLLALPLLALHQRALPVLSQDEVDAAIGATQPGFFNCIAPAAECFAYQLLELAPAAGSEAFERGARVQEAAAFAGI